MRIGELATRCGVPATTIRYYESVGLLPTAERSASGHRSYGPADLNRLLLIKRLRLLGVDLPALRDLIDFASTNCCSPVRERLLPVVEQRLVDLDRQFAELSLLRTDLLHYRDALRAGLEQRDESDERFTCCAPATCACLGDDHV